MPKFLEIFPVAQAQGINAIAQPTWGTINIQNGGAQNSTITMSADKTSVVVGQTFKLTIEIRTNNIEINEYRIFINFDPNRLQVLDKNTNVAGSQITTLDQLFLVQNPAQDNLVTNGEIKLIAKTQTGNAFQVNRIVAEVEFQVQATGSTTIQVAQGSGKTALIRANGTSLNFTTNSQIINLTAASSQNGNQNNNQNQNNQNNGQTGNNPPPTQTIPDTSIIEGGVGNIVIIFIALLFIIIGISLTRESNVQKK